MSKWDKYESQLVDRMQEEAHEAWLEEKSLLLEKLNKLAEALEGYADGDKHFIPDKWSETVMESIKFIERSKD